MTELLQNFIGGRWVAGQGTGTSLFDPITGNELVRVSSAGLDLISGFSFARKEAGQLLRAMTYAQRAKLLEEVGTVLQANRDAYYEIATANSGTVKSDSAVDIDGALYTVATFAKLGKTLGERRHLVDGDSVSLAKDAKFLSQHLQVPTKGLALFINAFNFPAWGLWEKAAPALLSGVPVVVKPATSTAWLTQRMVKDVVDAGVLPVGALSVVCGSSAGLLDALEEFDVLSFTGSADTAATIRRHPAIAQRSVRINIEADSINSALLMPNCAIDSPSFESLVKEVAREMTVKSGQKCTAIRRIFVPQELFDSAGQAISARLSKITVGNPRNETVRMGSLVSRDQLATVKEGLAMLKSDSEVLYNGEAQPLVDVDPAVASCMAPTLLGVRDGDAGGKVHDHEVFGPVATLIPFRNLEHAQQLVRRGGGSLVVSLYGSDETALAATAVDLAECHGRVHVVTPEVSAIHSGHGNVMPQSLHGGPGRAGGGEELGGLRALNFYHRRAAVQGAQGVVDSVRS
ncbi:MAG: 3,4-dehydroadipyl-CoA semialdehyde dehydrogenase [Proteobacteria bacterium]|nr:3,4-dehydroadipyl-CoA semialdehyde dehydrogenase [Pseudomonadota bacterium]